MGRKNCLWSNSLSSLQVTITRSRILPSWRWQNTWLPVGSSEWSSCFALLACLVSVFPIKLSSAWAEHNTRKTKMTPQVYLPSILYQRVCLKSISKSMSKWKRIVKFSCLINNNNNPTSLSMQTNALRSFQNNLEFDRLPNKSGKIKQEMHDSQWKLYTVIQHWKGKNFV